MNLLAELILWSRVRPFRFGRRQYFFRSASLLKASWYLLPLPPRHILSFPVRAFFALRTIAAFGGMVTFPCPIWDSAVSGRISLDDVITSCVCVSAVSCDVMMSA